MPRASFRGSPARTTTVSATTSKSAGAWWTTGRPRPAEGDAADLSRPHELTSPFRETWRKCPQRGWRLTVGDRSPQLSRIVGRDDQDPGELIGGQPQATFTPQVAGATHQPDAYRPAGHLQEPQFRGHAHRRGRSTVWPLETATCLPIVSGHVRTDRGRSVLAMSGRARHATWVGGRRASPARRTAHELGPDPLVETARNKRGRRLAPDSRSNAATVSAAAQQARGLAGVVTGTVCPARRQLRCGPGGAHLSREACSGAPLPPRRMTHPRAHHQPRHHDSPTHRGQIGPRGGVAVDDITDEVRVRTVCNGDLTIGPTNAAAPAGPRQFAVS